MRKRHEHWPAQRSSISAQLMIQFGQELGLSRERCLAGTGLTAQQLANAAGEISANQELQLISNLVAAQEPGSTCGLFAGQRYHLSSYGIWGFALLSSPTFRSAALLGLRYLDLTYAFCHIRLEDQGEELHLLFDDQALAPTLRAFLVERDSAGMLGLQRDLLGRQLPLLRVDLRRTRPRDCSAYRQVYGIEPQFEQGENRFVFAQALLDQPLPGANPQAAQQCEAQCAALLATRRERAGLAGEIRTRLLSRPGQLLNMDEVAALFNTSTRTLHRRLRAEGSSFRALQEEVRQTLAEELLATGALSLTEIAERLSYAELSNFIHAFKRWKGLSPHQYRQRLRANA